MAASSKIIPKFIKGKDEKDLEKKILFYQMNKGKQFTFINIYPTKDGIVAWYYEESTLKEALDGNTSG